MSAHRELVPPELLSAAADRAARYLAALRERRVPADPAAVAALEQLDEPLPDGPASPLEVVRVLDEIGTPATVATAGPRYFGLVVGGALPASLAANWLAGAWDQCVGMRHLTPAGARIEEIALRWVREALGLPADADGGLVSGATMANFAGLAAARHALLGRAGWDVEADGLFGAPPVEVLVGEEVHASALKALALLGLGRRRVTRVPVDAQGRMRVDALPADTEPAIVCIQAGNVNSGAFDPAGPICDWAHERGGWVHVDGAFGLWAAACPSRAELARDFDRADSWSLDAHKWLNVPYDCGVALCRHPAALRAAMGANAPYLLADAQRQPCDYTPEMSRRARGVEVWAALKSLGRQGLADMVERCCRHATRFAEELAALGCEVLNDVVLNQVVVAFGDDETTRRTIREIQAEGTCWCGGTSWRGRHAMRISVSSWATTEADVDRSVTAMRRCLERVRAES